MTGKVVDKKFSEMKKEIKKIYYPKHLDFTQFETSLEIITKDYIKSLISKNKSQLTINEYGRTISHFLNFCQIYIGEKLTLKHHSHPHL